ncbi:type II toxin-antitoxin system PemK/MazF family toxin [Demequina sp. TTPB684]|uniref:type II toxin-antitoxin system PemK/MazF family toxin n=1 Tax=unclassified Demequina TaxID=2620311 RepID=UPI001CF32B49|nr:MULTISPECIES: type II toxin-antitoxin system PemK/MazF family toxin [unclassified Demequina]MCB2412143.1 type II toxin-antitoxin system PemK/MazF family toxin [Demequina sp. TTPB684]UPU88595.1 type II toxin-antitoxin system PemK/MazF family toxin [Demequina sp. TMPB413]
MRRGEIRWVALDAGADAEARSRAQRPAVIVSNDGANTAAARRGSGAVTVVPLTTSDAPAKPFQVALAAGVGGLPRAAKAMAEQVRTVSAGRVGPSIGMLSLSDVAKIDDALRLHLGLDRGR